MVFDHVSAMQPETKQNIAGQFVVLEVKAGHRHPVSSHLFQ
jgi:hypothetical protein